MYCGNLTIDNCTVVASGGTHGLYTKTGPEHGLTLRGEHTLLNLTGTESAMNYVQRFDLDKMLMILSPRVLNFMDGSIWLGKEKQTHVVIGAPRTDDNVEVPEIREDYQTNFSFRPDRPEDRRGSERGKCSNQQCLLQSACSK